MITDIGRSDTWVVLSRDHKSTPHIPTIPDNPMQGVIRFAYGRYEIYDNGQWHVWPGQTIDVKLTWSANVVLEWAQQKMMQEALLADMARTNPTIADAVAQVKTAEEQLLMVMTLAEKSK